MTLNPLSRSLSFRLLVIFIATGIAVLILLSVFFSRGLGAQWQRSIQPHLERYIVQIQEELGNPPLEENAQRIADELPVNIYVYRNGEYQFSTNNETLPLSDIRFRRPPRRQIARDADRPQDRQPTRKRLNVTVAEYERTNLIRIRRGDYEVYHQLDRGRGRGAHRDHLLYALAALAGVLGLAWLIIRMQLKPIRQIQHGVQRMTAGELDHRLALKGQDDLSKLGDSIDGMAERIEQMLDAKRQLLLSISHELRSPVTRSRVAAEMLPDSVNRDRIIEDLDDMERMIEDIMESERLQRGHAVLNTTVVNLPDVIDSVVDGFNSNETFDDGNARPKVEVQLAEGVGTLQGDEARLRILVRNLIHNALQHGWPTTPANEPVRVSLSHRDSHLMLEVADKGPGLPEAALEQVTDAFYRPDTARTRDRGGFGLGLTLCQRIAEAHGGSLTISSQPEDTPGTQVVVSLPLN